MADHLSPAVWCIRFSTSPGAPHDAMEFPGNRQSDLLHLQLSLSPIARAVLILVRSKADVLPQRNSGRLAADRRPIDLETIHWQSGHGMESSLVGSDDIHVWWGLAGRSFLGNAKKIQSKDFDLDFSPAGFANGVRWGEPFHQ